MSNSRQVRDILNALRRQGFRIERKSRGWMAFPPNPEHGPIAIHGTNSDHRWIANLESQVRRAGYQGKLPR